MEPHAYSRGAGGSTHRLFSQFRNKEQSRISYYADHISVTPQCQPPAEGEIGVQSETHAGPGLGALSWGAGTICIVSMLGTIKPNYKLCIRWKPLQAMECCSTSYTPSSSTLPCQVLFLDEQQSLSEIGGECSIRFSLLGPCPVVGEWAFLLQCRRPEALLPSILLITPCLYWGAWLCLEQRAMPH